MKLFGGLLVLFALLASPVSAREPLRIAAAADLKFAMDEILRLYAARDRDARIDVVYGSSGQFRTQIEQNAPFDLYFSADIAYPRALAAKGLAASAVQPYAVGRLVLWSAQDDARALSLADLRRAEFTRIAIANPRHAPYGQRAEEALRKAGVWETVMPRLVYGENIAQAAQFVQSGNAQVGIIALSLALDPALRGAYTLIPESLHAPLVQGFIITRRAADKPEARRFAAFITGAEARAVMSRHGFRLPDQSAAAAP